MRIESALVHPGSACPAFVRPGRNRRNGFSLIEILVVLVILAVVAAALTVAMGSVGGERELSREAERAQALIVYACERAELSGRSIGLSFAKTGYRFSYLDRDVWMAYHDDELRTRRWPPNFVSVLTRDGQPVQLEPSFPDKPQMLCYASGELTSFRLELTLPDLAHRYRLDALSDGRVALATIDLPASR